MWKLLFEFINYLKNNVARSNLKSDDKTDDIDIKLIKTNMIKLGYSNNDFFKLQEENSSSREILIAIGWLISTYDLIELISQNILNLYNDEYFKEKLTKVI